MAEEQCITRGNRFKDITGLVVGRLTVVSFAGMKPRAKWRCRCECGNECEVATKFLTTARTVSCGCVRSEKSGTRTHGKTRTPEHRTWKGIRQRCTNENSEDFDSYGGRGIKVCERWWNSFAAFLEDMGERPSRHHSIERKNNDGDYEPANCIWATKKVQNRNTQRTTLVEYRGQTHKLCDLCDSRGIPTEAARRRIGKGWTVEQAIETPIGEKPRR